MMTIESIVITTQRSMPCGLSRIQSWGGLLLKNKHFAALTMFATLSSCGGGGGTSLSSPIVTIPTGTTPPTVPTPPPVATPSSTPARFSAAQKIEGIQITIPYSQQGGNYTFDFTIEAFYVVGNRLSVLKSFFPSNTNVSGKYGDEFAYALSGNNATKVNSVVATSMPADTIETSTKTVSKTFSLEMLVMMLATLLGEKTNC